MLKILGTAISVRLQQIYLKARFSNLEVALHIVNRDLGEREQSDVSANVFSLVSFVLAYVYYRFHQY